jgi:hypothetical protein
MASIWLVGGLFELSEVQSQRMRCVRVHVLKQKLAVPFYGVERRAQVMTQTAVEGF